MGRDYSGLYVSSVQMLFGMGGASRYPIPSHTESTLRQKHITSELTERLTKQRIEFAVFITIGGLLPCISLIFYRSASGEVRCFS